MKHWINVVDFGASPDGRALCTQAFQSAIDKCASNGGGTVYCPPGEYCLEMVSLKSHVELNLERGSRLISKLKPVEQLNRKCEEMTTNHERYLIGGVGLTDIAVTGKGIIDGCGMDEFWNVDPAKNYRLYIDRYWPKLHRPKGMLHFKECKGVTIEGVTLKDPPAYNVWLLGCDRVNISGIFIDTDLLGPNTDGLDIDCCSNVNIENCDIVAGDDAIAIKTDINELGYDKASENITVSNCRLKTTSCGIRLGYEGDGEIRNCIFSNIVIYESLIGISLMVTLSPNNKRGLIVKKGTPIHDIIFTDMVIDSMQTFNFQQLKEEPGPQEGYIDKVRFNNITASAIRGSYIGGHKENYIRGLNFTNISMTLSGEMGTDMHKQVPYPYPMWNDLQYSGIPYAFYARYVDNLSFNQLEIQWKKTVGDWLGAIKTACVNKLETSRIETINCPVPKDEIIKTDNEIN